MSAEVQPTEFETLFRLIPLGEDMTARVERAEAVICLMLRAIRHDPGIVQAFDAKVTRVPVPDMFEVDKVLNLYRTSRDRQWESMHEDPGYNPW